MTILSQALRITNNQVVAFVGSGGKTSALFRTANDLSPAFVTTTTHLGAWQSDLTERHFIWKPDASMPEMESGIGCGGILVTGELDIGTNRLRGLTTPQLEKLRQLAAHQYLPLLIEADGSRQKALKAPGDNEPAIPDFVDVVVVVAGLSGLGQPLSENVVHRAQNFGCLGGLAEGDLVTLESLARVLSNPFGGLKNIPAGARRVLLLNQADTPELQSQANQISQILINTFDAVVVSVLQPPPGSVLAIKEDIAAIILAADEASSIGQPRQLLEFNGIPSVRWVAQTALRAGLSPVSVIAGENIQAVSAVVADLPIRVIHNPDWISGTSTSIKAGLHNLNRKPGGVVILKADQPQVSVELLWAMVERHSQDLPAILAPYVFDECSSPMLFDQSTFQDLLAITGNDMGRSIFSKFSPRYLNWYDRSLLLDLGQAQDYRKMLDGEPQA